jgi:hypothetical protein
MTTGGARPLVQIDPDALATYVAATTRLDDELRLTLAAVVPALAATSDPEALAVSSRVERLLDAWSEADATIVHVLRAARAIRLTAGGADLVVAAPASQLSDALHQVHATAGAQAAVVAFARVPTTLQGPALRDWVDRTEGDLIADLVAALHRAAWEPRRDPVGPLAVRSLEHLATGLRDAFDAADPAASARLLDAVGDPTTLAWLAAAGLTLPAGAAVAAFDRWYVPALGERIRRTDPTIGLDPPRHLVAFTPTVPEASPPEALLDLVTGAVGGAALLARHTIEPDDVLRRQLGLDGRPLGAVQLLELPVEPTDGGAAQARLLEALARQPEHAVADAATSVLLSRATGERGIAAALLPAARLVADRHLADLATALALPLHHGRGEPSVVDGRLALDAAGAATLVGRALLDPVAATILLPPLTDHLARRAVAGLALEGTPSVGGDWLRSLVGFDEAVAHAAHERAVEASNAAPSALAWRSVLLAVDVGTAIAAVTGHLPSTLRTPMIAPLHDAARRARTPTTGRVAAADAIGLGCHQVTALGLATGRFASDDPILDALGPRFRSGNVLTPWWELDDAERVAFVHAVTAATTSFSSAGLPTPGEIAALHADLAVVLRGSAP